MEDSMNLSTGGWSIPPVTALRIALMRMATFSARPELSNKGSGLARGMSATLPLRFLLSSLAAPIKPDPFKQRERGRPRLPLPPFPWFPLIGSSTLFRTAQRARHRDFIRDVQEALDCEVDRVRAGRKRCQHQIHSVLGCRRHESSVGDAALKTCAPTR